MTNHPGDEMLLAYAADEAGAAAAAAIGDHLAHCRRCSATVAGYRLVRDLVRADAGPPPEAVARVKALFAGTVGAARRIVAEVTFDSWGVLAPGLAGVRGGLAGRQLVWTSSDAEVDLQLAPSPRGEWNLIGQVAADDLTDTTVELVTPGGAGGDRKATADPFGMFEFDVPPGRYDLLVRLPQAVLVLPNLEVGVRA